MATGMETAPESSVTPDLPKLDFREQEQMGIDQHMISIPG